MKWRRGLVLVRAVVAAIAVVAALTSRPNEFAFLRKYPHTESLTPPDFVWEQIRPAWPASTRKRIFEFPDLSKELYSEIKSFAKTPTAVQRFDIELPNGRKGTFIHRLENSRLIFYDEPSPSWLAVRWAGVRRHLGWVDPEEKAAKEKFANSSVASGRGRGKP